MGNSDAFFVHPSLIFLGNSSVCYTFCFSSRDSLRLILTATLVLLFCYIRWFSCVCPGLTCTPNWTRVSSFNCIRQLPGTEEILRHIVLWPSICVWCRPRSAVAYRPHLAAPPDEWRFRFTIVCPDEPSFSTPGTIFSREGRKCFLPSDSSW